MLVPKTQAVHSAVAQPLLTIHHLIIRIVLTAVANKASHVAVRQGIAPKMRLWDVTGANLGTAVVLSVPCSSANVSTCARENVLETDLFMCIIMTKYMCGL